MVHRFCRRDDPFHFINKPKITVYKCKFLTLFIGATRNKKGGRNVIHLGHIRWFISIKLQKSGSRCDKRRFEWWQCQPRIIWSIDDGGTRHGTRSNTRFVTTPFCYMPPFSIVHSGRFSRPFDIVTRLPSYRYPNQDGHCWLNRFIIIFLFFQNENLLVRFERLRSVAQLIGD